MRTDCRVFENAYLKRGASATPHTDSPRKQKGIFKDPIVFMGERGVSKFSKREREKHGWDGYFFAYSFFLSFLSFLPLFSLCQSFPPKALRPPPLRFPQRQRRSRSAHRSGPKMTCRDVGTSWPTAFSHGSQNFRRPSDVICARLWLLCRWRGVVVSVSLESR